MNQLIRTESGSTYEHDPKEKRIRRLEGELQPTPRQGSDGEWKLYGELVGPEVGKSMGIIWRFDIDGQIIARTTITSYVISIDQIQGEQS